MIKDILKCGISTCPNDTFIFAALFEERISSIYKFDLIMSDIEVLNQHALNGDLDIVKVSYGVLPHIMDKYSILPAGGAMGFGVGPLFLSLDGNVPVADVDVDNNSSKDLKIAIPGFNTTAFKVFSIFYPQLIDNCIPVRFDKIMPGIQSGEYSAGVVIHEGRFTYAEYNLNKIADLGELWHSKYNMPLPLGAIALKRTLTSIAPTINALILKSIDYAYQNSSTVIPFIKKHSDEMDISVMKSHIELYVNDYSKDARKGIEGISALLNLDKSSMLDKSAIFFNI